MSEEKHHDKGCCSDCGYLTANAEITGAIRTHMHDGREMMIIPVVAIVEGVLNGALVPNEEIEKFVTAWEGVPVPVHHPQINGQHVSSNIPTVLESRVIGRFHNVKAEGGKLKGELWIDVNKATEKGFADVLETFRSGEMMEVSTAYFADTDQQSGIFNGKRYNGIHRNLRPDHLAVLPGEIGACSIADGCGALRANRESSVMSKISDAFAALGEALGLKAHVEEAEIQEPAINEEESTEVMESDDAKAKEDDQPTANGEQPETNEVQEMSEQAQAPQLDAETLTAVNWAKAKYEETKNRLVSKLVANESCAFGEDRLKAMHVDDLEALDKSLSPRDYSGKGLPVVNASESDEEVLSTPEPVVLKSVGGDK